MDWVAVSAVAGAVSATAGTTGAVVAARALRRNREDQARRDAAGLHASAYMAAQRFAPGQEPSADEEPSDLTDVWLVVKVTNASSHPYYAVVSSIFLRSLQKRFAAVADMVPPNSSRYAGLIRVDGCDGAGLDANTLVTTTFIDSQGRGWHRDSDGKLERCSIARRWRTAELHARPHRGAALHRIREASETNDDGYAWHIMRDEGGFEVEVSSFEVPASETSADDEAFPMPLSERAAPDGELQLGP
jgi:hypothetical protein